MKANARSREILFKELPWMKELLPHNAVEFNVKLVDLDTLSLHPGGGEFIGAWCPAGKILLVNTNGYVVGEVGVFHENKHSREFIWRRLRFRKVMEVLTVHKPETVEQAINRYASIHGNPWLNVRFIVEFSSVYVPPSVTVYKVPKRIPSLKAWLDEKAAEESQRLRDVLEEANAEA